jgi:hypothetical protein
MYHVRLATLGDPVIWEDPYPTVHEASEAILEHYRDCLDALRMGYMSDIDSLTSYTIHGNGRIYNSRGKEL